MRPFSISLHPAAAILCLFGLLSGFLSGCGVHDFSSNPFDRSFEIAEELRKVEEKNARELATVIEAQRMGLTLDASLYSTQDKATIGITRDKTDHPFHLEGEAGRTQWGVLANREDGATLHGFGLGITYSAGSILPLYLNGAYKSVDYAEKRYYFQEVFLRSPLSPGSPSSGSQNLDLDVLTSFETSVPTEAWRALTLIEAKEDVSIWGKDFPYGTLIRVQQGERLGLGVFGALTKKGTEISFHKDVVLADKRWTYKGDIPILTSNIDPLQELDKKTQYEREGHLKIAFSFEALGVDTTGMMSTKGDAMNGDDAMGGEEMTEQKASLQISSADFYFIRDKHLYVFMRDSSEMDVIDKSMDGFVTQLNLIPCTCPLPAEIPVLGEPTETKIDFTKGSITGAFFGPQHDYFSGILQISDQNNMHQILGLFLLPKLSN